jgi:2-keto-4-pentenoate hydratase/2-oxohepta-3-ene-1,7-dioic acid hydratase in catechol pathway
VAPALSHTRHTRSTSGTGSDIPDQPILFTKHQTCVIGPRDPIIRPTEVDDLDYEAELAVVIGRRCKNVPRDRALDVVAGYTCANDVSARKAQLGSPQWVRGKSFDTFCPLGPWLVTADEIPDPQQLRVMCRVDGAVMQDQPTSDMLFDVATLIEFISRGTTLEPGDVILTGTPSGVALGRTPPPWLRPGQVCEVEISNIGVLRNTIEQEA